MQKIQKGDIVGHDYYYYYFGALHYKDMSGATEPAALHDEDTMSIFSKDFFKMAF